MKSPHATAGFLMIFLFALLLQPGLGSIVDGKTPDGDIAIQGYDPVAYFQAGEAKKGSEYAFRWHNLTWYFISEENRDLFQANPERFAPQYDGYCAWAMTESRKAEIDPKVWKIVDGKLYLNCSRASYEKWSRDIPGNIEKADANWLKMKSQTR